MDLELLGLIAAFFMLGGKKTTPRSSDIKAIEDKFPVVMTKPSAAVATKTPPGLDDFQRRAAAKRAHDWIPYFEKAGATPELAKGLARWAGIESSGNPLAVSPIGERGLLQATKTSALKEKLFTPSEWDALISPNTTQATHARLALKQFGYHVLRARKWIANPPPASDVASWLYYAKAHHSRPADLTTDKMHGPAAFMATDLAKRHANGDPLRKKRMFSAAVVAFGGLNNAA